MVCGGEGDVGTQTETAAGFPALMLPFPLAPGSGLGNQLCSRQGQFPEIIGMASIPGAN